MLRRGSITPADALREARCMRLASRIHDLRGMGYTIHAKLVTEAGKQFSRYTLIG